MGGAGELRTYPVEDADGLCSVFLGPWAHLLCIYIVRDLAPVPLDSVHILLYVRILVRELLQIGFQHCGCDILTVVMLDESPGEAEITLAH